MVLAGQSLNVLTSGVSVDAGILIVGAVTGAVASPVIIIFTVTIAMTNLMNIYGGALSMIAIGQTFKPAWLPRALDFAPRLRLLLEATAVGLTETV